MMKAFFLSVPSHRQEKPRFKDMVTGMQAIMTEGFQFEHKHEDGKEVQANWIKPEGQITSDVICELPISVFNHQLSGCLLP